MPTFPKLSKLPRTREQLLAIVALVLQAADGKAPDNMNATSRSYRVKASDFATLASGEHDEDRMRDFVTQALSWIQLAENEEMLHDARLAEGSTEENITSMQ